METKYTPALIGNEKEDPIIFSIPLYQRLFEWQKTEIIQLLNDLKAASEKKPQPPYYIGMLTAYKQKDRYDLVDGQQRFTVLMLMGIVFGWTDFLTVKNNGRLSFFARTNDEQYFKSKINGESTIEYSNAKMEAGLDCIKEFVSNLKDKKADFINYVYNNLTFFISYLPPKYELHDLNRYFEAMNATGRGLENHEILKVNLLKELDPKDQEKYTRIWNAVSDMDKPIIRQRHDNETIDMFRARQNEALSSLSNHDQLTTFCNFNYNQNIKSPENSTDKFPTIRDIVSVKAAPPAQYRAIGERSILNFPEFLLQVLSLQIIEGDKTLTPDFYNVHKLLETFKNLINGDVELFFKNLLKYRILFDYFIIRISTNDQNSSTYTLAFKDDVAESIDREKLIKYLSMLYVSTSSNIWISKALSYLAIDATTVEAILFYKELVNFDNSRRKDIETLSLKYGEIDRYWFWRLDFYLWEKEVQKEKPNQNNAILEYSFRANRSIEHLHPQTSATPWESIFLNSFGNLAMISPSFNSTQSNDDENVKFARVENQINGKYQLESIKLLLMYQQSKEYDMKWNIELAIKHGNEMIDVLINSFEDIGAYQEIRGKLMSQKSKQ